MVRIALILFVVVFSPLVGAQVERPDPLPERRPLSLVSSMDQKVLDLLSEELRRISITVTCYQGADDAVILDTVRSLSPEDRPDILFGVSTIVLSRFADQGFLEPYAPAWGDALAVGLADRDHNWYALFGEPLVIVYNQEYFLESDMLDRLPLGWEDLGHSQYFGSLLLQRPTPFNETGYLLACLIDRADQMEGDGEAGFDLLYDIDNNLIRTWDDIETLLSPNALFSGGDGSISAACIRRVRNAVEKGMPADFILPSEGLFLYPKGIALLKNASEEARTLYDALTDRRLLLLVSEACSAVPFCAPEGFRLRLWQGQQLPDDYFPTNHDSVRRNMGTWMNEWQNRIHGQAKKRTRVIDDAINTTMTFLIPVILVIIIITSRSTRRQKNRSK